MSVSVDLLTVARPAPVPDLGLARCIVLPDFGPSSRRFEFVAALGASVMELVRASLPGLPPEMYCRLRVTLGDVVLPIETWSRVRPKAHAPVLIRAMPGATDYFRSALFLAVAVASIATGQFYGAAAATSLLGSAGLTGFTATAATAQLATSLISAAALTAGTVLVNALVPVRQADQAGDPGTSYTINGFQNRPNVDGPVPQLWGTMRIAPPYIVLPFGEVVSRQKWTRVAFLPSQGPLDLAAHASAIGTTTIASGGDVTLGLRSGGPGDDPLTYCNETVIEESLGIQVRYDEPAPIRTTVGGASACTVELVFPGGLFNVRDDGAYIARTMSASIAYRAVGTSSWSGSTPLAVTTMDRRTFWISQRIEFPVAGRYEVRVTRDYPDDASSSQQTAYGWSALRSHRPQYPINLGVPVALAEVRMRASGRLNGTLDNFNLLGSRVIPDWTGSTWAEQATSNPSSISRAVLQGPQNLWPEPDEALDLPAFQEWAEFCPDNNLEFDHYQVAEITRDDFLDDVASAGRALVFRRDGMWTVVIDRLRTQFHQLITPRNSWGLVEDDPPPNFPDAFVVDFIDRTNNYQPSRRVIRWPGFVGDPVRIEELRLPGKTNPDEIWIEARRRQYEAIYRRRSWTVSMDWEHLILTRGDAAILAHPVIDRLQTGGRVRAVHDGIVYIDEDVIISAGLVYEAAFRSAGNVITTRSLDMPASGTTRRLVLADAGTDPAVGDLVTVYTTATAAEEVIVQKIERGDNHTAVLTLIPHAPEIFTLTAAEVPPTWDPTVGSIEESPLPAPAVPLVTSVASGDASIIVYVAAGDITPVYQWQLRHRLLGTSTWGTTVTALGGSDAISIVDFAYSAGQHVEFQVRAVGVNALTSAWSISYDHVYPVDEYDPAPLRADMSDVTADTTSRTADEA